MFSRRPRSSAPSPLQSRRCASAKSRSTSSAEAYCCFGSSLKKLITSGRFVVFRRLHQVLARGGILQLREVPPGAALRILSDSSRHVRKLQRPLPHGPLLHAPERQAGG